MKLMIVLRLSRHIIKIFDNINKCVKRYNNFMKIIRNLNNGVKYMLIASFTFAIMGAFAKLSSQPMSSLEVVFFRNVFGVILIGFAVLKKPMKHIGGKPWLLFFRGGLRTFSWDTIIFFFN